MHGANVHYVDYSVIGLMVVFARMCVAHRLVDEIIRMTIDCGGENQWLELLFNQFRPCNNKDNIVWILWNYMNLCIILYLSALTADDLINFFTQTIEPQAVKLIEAYGESKAPTVTVSCY